MSCWPRIECATETALFHLYQGRFLQVAVTQPWLVPIENAQTGEQPSPVIEDSEPPEPTLRRRDTRFWLTSAARSAATSDSPTAAPSAASSVIALPPPYMLRATTAFYISFNQFSLVSYFSVWFNGVYKSGSRQVLRADCT